MAGFPGDREELRDVLGFREIVEVQQPSRLAQLLVVQTGSFVVGWIADFGVVNDVESETVNAVTSSLGGSSFGAVTTFAVSPVTNAGLNVSTGRATLLWNTFSSGASESTELVS